MKIASGALNQTSLFLLLAILVVGCTHRLPFKPPSPLIDSPEAIGVTNRWKVGAQYFYTPEAVLSPDVALQNPSPNNAALRPVDNISLLGAIGFGKNWDVEFRIPARLHVKYQVVGEPRIASEKGNFSVALQGGLGFTKQDETRDSYSGASLFSKDEFETFLALTMGYRLSEVVLLFGGFHFVTNSVSGEFSAPGRGITSQPYSAIISSLGPNLGLEFAAKAFLIRFQATSDSVVIGNVENTFIMGGMEAVVHLGKKEED